MLNDLFGRLWLFFQVVVSRMSFSTNKLFERLSVKSTTVFSTKQKHESMQGWTTLTNTQSHFKIKSRIVYRIVCAHTGLRFCLTLKSICILHGRLSLVKDPKTYIGKENISMNWRLRVLSIVRSQLAWQPADAANSVTTSPARQHAGEPVNKEAASPVSLWIVKWRNSL